MMLKAKISLMLCILVVILDVFRLSDANTSVNQNFSGDVEHFGNRLLTQLEKENPQKDIIFSPFSIETCLAMTRMGAEGETAAEIDKALFLSPQNSNDIANNFHSVLEEYQSSSVLKMANKIYAMTGYEIQDEFNNLLTQQFFSSVDPLNFTESEAAAQTINSWVEHETNNRIKNLVSSSNLDQYTRLVLVNAIYFKGNWVKEFNELFTSESDFYLEDGRTTKVQMMFNHGEYNFIKLPELDATAVELSYRDSDLSLIIVLPKNITGLAHLENKMQTTSLTDIVQKMKPADMYLNIPKFKAEFKAELKDALSNMDMKRMFSGQAEFGKMLKSGEGLQVTSVVHKAFIEVNERGTEAAAATELEASDRMGVSTVFLADHGFLYYLRSKNGIVLFEGKQAYFN